MGDKLGTSKILEKMSDLVVKLMNAADIESHRCICKIYVRDPEVAAKVNFESPLFSSIDRFTDTKAEFQEKNKAPFKTKTKISFGSH